MYKIYKRWLFIIILSLLTFILSLNINCLAHEGPLYKILMLNKSIGFMLLSSSLDTQKHIIKIKYLPNSGVTETVTVAIAEILDDFTDIKLINNLEIKTSRLVEGEINKVVQYSNPNFKEGKVIVLWISQEKLSNEKLSLNIKKNILERAETVLSEQIRLANIAADQGKDELANEVCRNVDE